MKKIAIVIVLALCGSMTHAQDANYDYLETVDGHLDNLDYKKALKTLDEVIGNHPSEVDALVKRADIYLEMQKTKDAKKDILAVMVLDDQHPGGQLAFAELMYQDDDLDSALHYVDLGLSYAPSPDITESLYSLKGTILMAQDKYEDAEDALYKASRSAEVSIETMKNLATVLVENGKLDEAVIVLKETLEIFGNHLESYINTGYVCNEIRMYDEALFYLNKALEIEPENPYALANAALAYLHTGQLDKAYRMIERSVKNDNSNSYAYRVKAECLMAMGENSRACKEFKKAIQMGYTVLHEQTEITKLMIQSCNAD